MIYLVMDMTQAHIIPPFTPSASLLNLNIDIVVWLTTTMTDPNLELCFNLQTMINIWTQSSILVWDATLNMVCKPQIKHSSGFGPVMEQTTMLMGASGDGGNTWDQVVLMNE